MFRMQMVDKQESQLYIYGLTLRDAVPKLPYGPVNGDFTRPADHHGVMAIRRIRTRCGIL